MPGSPELSSFALRLNRLRRFFTLEIHAENAVGQMFWLELASQFLVSASTNILRIFEQHQNFLNLQLRGPQSCFRTVRELRSRLTKRISADAFAALHISLLGLKNSLVKNSNVSKRKGAIYIVFLPTSGFTNVCIKSCLFILWRLRRRSTL